MTLKLLLVVTVQEGVANSTARGRGSCDRTLAWHSNKYVPIV
jgi:hypothetical protein